VARRSSSPSPTPAAIAEGEHDFLAEPPAGPVVAPAVAPSWPAPAGGQRSLPGIGNGAPPVAREVGQRPPPVAPRPTGPAPVGAKVPPPVGPGGLPEFGAYVQQTDLGNVELDDRYEALPDDLYVEAEVRSCDYRQSDSNAALVLLVRLQVTYPQEHKGAMIRDWVTLPDEVLHQGDQLNAIQKRFKMFCDACEKLSPDGRSCTAKSPQEFVGEIVAFKTRNKEVSYTDKVTGEKQTRTYTNVGFSYWRADKTPGLVSSGETVPVPDKRWAPQ